jgi:endonuclease I
MGDPDWVEAALCSATDDVDGPVTCDYSGYVDKSIAGSYIITYTAIDSSNNETVIAVTHTVIDESNPGGGIILTEYYATVDGLTGQALVLELRSIINTGLTRVTYGDTRYILDETDADPNNSSNLILLYLGTSVSGVWDLGVTWNREHVWPQSLLGVPADNDTKNAASDLHNLKPADPATNSSRGNKFYDVATDTDSYLPRAEVRGDIARILLYMTVMYEIYTLVNTTPTVYQMAMLDVLLQWNLDDPVDDFERNRNEVIFTYQHNRNPFIDYPEFVSMIWN